MLATTELWEVSDGPAKLNVPSPDALCQLGDIAFTQSSNFVLVVVPLFVLMGEALAATGIGNDLFHTAHMWLPRLPGALAVATVFACAVFAAVCGWSPVTAATHRFDGRAGNDKARLRQVACARHGGRVPPMWPS